MYEVRIVDQNGEATFIRTGTEAELLETNLQEVSMIGGTIYLIDLETGEVVDEFKIEIEKDLEGLGLAPEDWARDLEEEI